MRTHLHPPLTGEHNRLCLNNSRLDLRLGGARSSQKAVQRRLRNPLASENLTRTLTAIAAIAIFAYDVGAFG